jgi:hypothetical protein
MIFWAPLFVVATLVAIVTFPVFGVQFMAASYYYDEEKKYGAEIYCAQSRSFQQTERGYDLSQEEGISPYMKEVYSKATYDDKDITKKILKS